VTFGVYAENGGIRSGRIGTSLARQQLMRRDGIVTGLLVVSTVASCIHSRFTPATDGAFAARAPGCHLDLVMHGSPTYAYKVIGRVTTSWHVPRLSILGDSRLAAVRRLQEKACVAGAHGLLQVTVNTRVWSKASPQLWGNALAFVYVDSDGRPLVAPPWPPPPLPPVVRASPASPSP
jgi:hypothetical protein